MFMQIPMILSHLICKKVVSKTTGTPEEAVVQMMMLRSLKQARYSEDALGHFGLAAEYYTHFTSPIRRYSDLMVHRMIHAYQEKGMGEETQKHFEKLLTRCCRSKPQLKKDVRLIRNVK